jgi:hypothetical protein
VGGMARNDKDRRGGGEGGWIQEERVEFIAEFFKYQRRIYVEAYESNSLINICTR